MPTGSISSFFSTLLDDTLNLLNTIKLNDYLDIAVVAIIFYYIIQLVRETRAMQLVKSVGVILVFYFFANALSLSTLKFLLEKRWISV